MQVCTSLKTVNHESTPPLSFFTGRVPFLPPNQQRQSTEGYMTLPVFAAERRRLLHGAPAAGTRRRRPRLSIDILCPQGDQQKNPSNAAAAVD